MSFNCIVTTSEPHMDLSVPLDETSLEPCPPQSPPIPDPEEVNGESIIESLSECIKTMSGVQNKLSDCTLTKLDLMNALVSTLYKLKEVKSRLLILDFDLYKPWTPERVTSTSNDMDSYTGIHEYPESLPDLISMDDEGSQSSQPPLCSPAEEVENDFNPIIE